MRQLTKDYLESCIVRQDFFTAGEALQYVLGTKAFDQAQLGMDRLTVCILTHRNGAKLVGINYGAIDPASHQPVVGRERARSQAFDKLYELEGFLLRDEEARKVRGDVPAAVVAPFNLQPGDRACTPCGIFQAEGTVVATFTTLAGEVRHVFEFDTPKGMTHIYTPNQLSLL